MARTTFANPIIPGFNPDPSICRVGDEFYLVTSSFEFFPGVPVYHSKDIVHWNLIGHCLTRRSQLHLENAPCSGGIWAPTLRHSDGVFYMITTNRQGGGIFFVTATNPEGPWSEPVRVAQEGIDPSLFFDEDGRVYLTSTGESNGTPGIVQSEIDVKTGRLLCSPVFLWTGTGGQCPEGPHMYKRGDTYYLMIAEGGTHYGHMVTVARSDSPWGPFESSPNNPALTHRDRNGHPIQGVGHADLAETADGSYLAVCHGFRLSKKYFHHLGRETFLVPVQFDKAGWPVFNSDGTVEMSMEADLPPAQPIHAESDRDEFDGGMSSHWCYLRNPVESSASLSERFGWLTLHGTARSLDDIGSPTFVCRRQQHFDCEIQAKMDFHPENPNEEAGLAIYYSNEHHYDFVVSRSGRGRRVFLRRTVGDIKYVAYEQEIDEGAILLAISADSLSYRFRSGAAEGDSVLSELGTARTQFLSTEAADNGFVGVFVGMYASGNGEPSITPAYFDWFDYRPLPEGGSER